MVLAVATSSDRMIEWLPGLVDRLRVDPSWALGTSMARDAKSKISYRLSRLAASQG
jgi:hypothetical protein